MNKVNLKIYNYKNQKLIPGNLTYNQIELLLKAEQKDAENLYMIARDIRNRIWGRKCFVRAVIEFSNICNKNCSYCALQNKNDELDRFLLDDDLIKRTFIKIKETEISTIYLQSGESKVTYNKLIKILQLLKDEKFYTIASVGVLNETEIKKIKNYIDGYIIKFETFNPVLHKLIRKQHRDRRINPINWLTRYKINVGSGNILGLPGQTKKDLIEDLLYLQYLQLPMNSVSPFIPSLNTEFYKYSKPSLVLTLNFIAALRIVNPIGLIPSVSALNLLSKEGQYLGLLSGANVLTVNFTPPYFQYKYPIYDESRYIVNYKHVKNICDDAGLIIDKDKSIGYKIYKKKLKSWFDYRYNNKQENFSVYGDISRFFRNKILNTITKKDIILDVGCGDGRYFTHISKRAKHIDAIEINQLAINKALMLNESNKLNNIEIINCDCLSFDSNKKYNLIILSKLIYYFNIEEITLFFSKIKKILIQKGLLYISFESPIIMRDSNNELFSLSEIKNYSFENVEKLANSINLHLFKREITKQKIKKKYNDSPFNGQQYYIREFFNFEYIFKKL